MSLKPWREVIVPQVLPWEKSSIEVKLAVSEWAALGIKPVQGVFGKESTLPASLLLPMGRFGPAFLVYPNFHAFLGWNESMVYSTTAAFFATRIMGAPPMQRGSEELKVLSNEEIIELQKILIAKNLLVGEADGKIGTDTRTAVRKAQLKEGLPADAYPTQEILLKLRK